MEPMEPKPEPTAVEQPPAPPPRVALRASLFAVAFVIALSTGAGIAGFALNHLTGRTEFVDLLVILAVAASFLGAGWVALLSVGRRPGEYLSLAVPGAKTWIAAVVLGLGTALWNGTLPARLFELAGSDYVEMLETMMANIEALATPLGLFILLGAVVPVCEELLFRGVILRSLLDRWSTWPAVGVAALIFAAFHLHPIHAVIALGLGIVAGWAMVVTGSVWTAVAVHATNNLLGVGAALIAPDFAVLPLWMVSVAAVVLAGGVALLRHAPEPPDAGGRSAWPTEPTDL